MDRTEKDSFRQMRPEMMPGVFFPSVPDPYAARLMAVLYQMEQIQWLTGEQLRARQSAQLDLLLRHAWETSPGYRKRLEAAAYNPARSSTDRTLWTHIPVLTRSELQQEFSSLASTAVPSAHGAVFPVESSGSTGRPVKALGTELTRFFWQVTTMRDHFWHQRDFSRSLFSIRPDRGCRDEIVSSEGWGPPVNMLMSSGPMWLMHSSADVEEQFDRLCEVRPDYLMTLPSNLRELSLLASERRICPIGTEIRTFGESVSDELRKMVRESFGVPLVDIYSASETGYLALQCPVGGCYHVCAETVLIEVLNDSGLPCQPGEIGRVVVTTLHNFALPLIRYEVGDYAQVGGPCHCGRGLPVLTRILGRVRGMALKPDGSRFWPSFPADNWMHIAPIRQLQLVQREVDSIEVIYAMERDLNSTEAQQLIAALNASLGFPYRIVCRRVDQIQRSQNGKFEDFISRMDI
jgi:phenylacetate-CoA ligase